MADLPERPSYLKYAFANAYNLSLLGGAVALSAATSDWSIAVVAAGVEALWLAIGADTAPFRRWVDRNHDGRLAEVAGARRRQRILALVDQRDRERAIDLVAAHRDMKAELDRNKEWSGELVRDEFGRLEALLNAWVELAEAVERFEGYTSGLDLNRLRRELSLQEELAAQEGQDPEARLLAAKNAELVRKRLETLEQMGMLSQRSRGQMSVIENTFRLLRDQIASLQVPKDIHGQIDEIVANVDAVRSVVAEGDASFQKLAEAPATAAAADGIESQATRSHSR